MVRRKEQYFGSQRPSQAPAMPYGARTHSMITGFFQFFPGLCHTPASAPAIIQGFLEVNRGSSQKLPMESYNLCSP